MGSKIKQLTISIDCYTALEHKGMVQTVFSTNDQDAPLSFVSGMGTIKAINSLHYSVGDKVVFCGYASTPLSPEIVTCENNITSIDDRFCSTYAYAGVYALLIHALNMIDISLGMVVILDAEADICNVVKKIANYRGVTTYSIKEVTENILADGAIVFHKKDSMVASFCKPTAIIAMVGESECEVQHSQHLVKVQEPGVLSQAPAFAVGGANIPRHYIPYTVSENLSTAVSMIRRGIVTDSDTVGLPLQIISNIKPITDTATITPPVQNIGDIARLFESRLTPINLSFSIWHHDVDTAKAFAFAMARNMIKTTILKSVCTQIEGNLIEIASCEDGSVVNTCIFKSSKKKLIIEGHFDSMSIKCEDGIASIFDNGLKPRLSKYSLNQIL